MAFQDTNSLTRISDIIGREPPYSLEAEQAVIGGLLMDPSASAKVMELLKQEHFYRPQHQQLFSIMMRIFANGTNEDIITVIDESVKRGIFETSAMAKTYLNGLAEGVPSTTNIESYCNIIIEKYNVRSLLNVANEIIENVNESSMDAKTMLDSAEQKIFNIRQGRDIAGLTRIDSILIDAYSHLQEISGPDAGKHLGAKTGYSHLDELTTGLNNSDLIILAARPAVGKSAFAINIATNVCSQTMKDVAVFSLEMGKEQVVTRMLSTEALVNNTVLRNGKIELEDWTKLARATDVLSRLPMYIDDTGSITVPQMKAKLRRVKNLGLVVIDYLQLMESTGKNQNRVNEIAEITRQLKLMAKQLNVPVIALSQLSRDVEKRNDKPRLSDLRDSGSIEQDADIIMFLHRDYYNTDNNQQKQTLAECIVAKNRHGSTDTVELGFIGEYTKFVDNGDIRKNDTAPKN